MSMNIPWCQQKSEELFNILKMDLTDTCVIFLIPKIYLIRFKLILSSKLRNKIGFNARKLSKKILIVPK